MANMVAERVHCILGGSCMLRAAGRLGCKCAFECMCCSSSLLLYLMRTKKSSLAIRTQPRLHLDDCDQTLIKY